MQTRPVRIPNPVPKFLADLLASHQKQIVSANFMQSTYSCSVCLTEYKGTKCVQLSCNHTFCRSCLEDFWGLCITEGDVVRVGCPDPECVKAGRAATEDEVCRIVTEDQLTRWRWLREKRALENGTATSASWLRETFTTIARSWRGIVSDPLLPSTYSISSIDGRRLWLGKAEDVSQMRFLFL